MALKPASSAFPAPSPRAEVVEPYDRRREFTVGDWETEAESAAAFDKAVPLDLFKVYREVYGVLMTPRPAQVERSQELGQEKIKMIVDRVLVPTEKLLDEGWRFGIVGVELKKSNSKIGPAIAQAMDYTRGLWLLDPPRSRFRVHLEYVFIWPMAKPGGTVASICSQQRVGSAYGDDRWCRFKLRSGESGIEVRHDGRMWISAGTSGARSGSR